MPQEQFPVAASIDTDGQAAAWSILLVERATERLRPGEVLEVKVSDPQLAADLTRILRTRGGVEAATRQSGDSLRLYLWRQGETPVRENQIPNPEEV